MIAVTTLAQLAADTLRHTFGGGSAVYYSLQGGLWRAAAWAGEDTANGIETLFSASIRSTGPTA